MRGNFPLKDYSLDLNKAQIIKIRLSKHINATIIYSFTKKSSPFLI